MGAKTGSEYKVGDVLTFSKTVTEHDIYTFAGVTGDMNPIHIDEEYSKKSLFGQRVAHGILSLGFVSTVVGSNISGAVYLSQTCKFLKPVFIGDTITATGELIAKDEEKKRMVWRTYCTNQRGETTLDGEAKMLYTT